MVRPVASPFKTAARCPSCRVMPSRRMGGAKRYLSVPVFVRDGFRFALPIIRIRLRDLAALIARGFASSFVPPELGGRREDRVLAAPAVSRAICANKRAHEHTGQRETLRPSLRNGFTAYFVLSPENGSFASVAAQKLPRSLAPAPRRPNHATSPYASGACVSRAVCVHRIPPRVRDVRNAPLIG
jgi:hypothetical protein